MQTFTPMDITVTVDNVNDGPPEITSNGGGATAAGLRDGFVRQLTSPVMWHDTMEWIAGADAPRVVLEVGPGRVLSNLARRAYGDVTFLPVGTVEDLDGLEAALQELDA